MKNIIALLLAVLFAGTLFAQEQLKSSKILYNQGLEELYELQKVHDGYLALGLKGSEATNKKLWLIKFNQRFEVVGSRIIYNEVLENPFKMVQLPNGNTMILAQQLKDKIKQSILIKLSPDGRILNAKVFQDKQNVELSDMVLVGNELFIYGAKKHITNEQPEYDKMLLIKTTTEAQVLWQKEYDLGQVELTSKQLIVDSRGDLLLTGTLVNLDLPKTEIKEPEIKTAVKKDTVYLEDEDGNLKMIIRNIEPEKPAYLIDNQLVYSDKKVMRKEDFQRALRDTTYVEDENGQLKMIVSKPKQLTKVKPQTMPTAVRSFYAIKFNKNGEKIKELTINNYAQYTYANAMIEHNDGYLFAVNPADYFGDGMLVQTDKNLNIQEKMNISGTPIIFSGIQKHQEKIIVGGIFSNTFNDYSPGFVVLDEQLKVQQAKADKSLFKHFFITNMSDMDEGHFMLNGIGYEHGKTSDIYFLPFTSSGQSACDMKSFEVKTSSVKTKVANHNFTTFKASESDLSQQELQVQLAEEPGFESGNICTTPDQEPINREDNKSWSKWQDNNADVFGMKIPTDWLQVSPNPSMTGKFFVQYDGMQNDGGLKVIVTDITGRQVQAKFIQNQDIFELDLSKFSTGIYNLNINDGHKSLTKKIEVLR